MPAPQDTFRALADPTRRDILHLLTQADMSIAEVSDQFDMTRAAVKKHLTVLSDGGLISVTTKGRERINQFRPEGLTPVIDWIATFDMFWDDRLDALKTALQQFEAQDD